MKKHKVALFISLLTAIMLLMHYVLYETIVSIYAISSASGLWGLRIAMVLLSLGFVAANILGIKYNNLAVKYFYRLTATWLGFLLYLYLASFVYGLCVGVFLLVSPEKDLAKFGEAMLGLGALVSLYGLYNGRRLTIKRVKVQLNNIPDSWKEKTVVFISDTHLGFVKGKRFLRRVVNTVNILKPDILFIGGDLYDGVKVDVTGIIDPLKKLKCKEGTYFITGNHDEFSEIRTQEYLDAVKALGIRVLFDEKIELDGVQVIGADYRQTVDRRQYSQILKNLNIDKRRPSILLKHVPSDIDLAAKAGISLQLSGHTHRAQVQPFSFLPKLVYKGFDYGLKSLGQTQVYTSSGVGTWGPPFRVGTHSEIVLLQFE